MQQMDSGSLHGSQGHELEGGDQEKSREAAMLNLFDPPEGSVQKLIECRVSNDDDAKQAIQTWMGLPENRDFV